MLGLREVNRQSVITATVRGGPLDQAIIYVNPPLNMIKDANEKQRAIQTALAIDMAADDAEESIMTGGPTKRLNEREYERLARDMLDGKTVDMQKMNGIAKQITLPDGQFNVLPDVSQRSVVYVSAPSGSGKSYWTSNFVTTWQHLFPDNFIFIFSRVEDDPAFNKFRNVVRVFVGDDYVANPLNASEIPPGSMCIFDDIDTFPIKLKRAVEHTRDDILEIGRHMHIHCVCTSHVLTDREHTKRMINEATHIVLFPGSNKEAVKRFLKDKLGMVKSQIDRCLNSPSRWICCYTRFPRHVITENQIFML